MKRERVGLREEKRKFEAVELKMHKRKNKTYDCLSREISINITTTIRTIEVCCRCSPLCWVWSASGDIGWDLAACKKPDSDKVRGPLHSIDTTTILVERGTVRVSSRFNRTSCAVGQFTVGIAVVKSSELGRLRRVEATGVLGVERDESLSDVVGSFENVHFTIRAVTVSNCPASESVSG